MYKIGAIGDRDSVLGFGALGVEVAFAETKDAAVTSEVTMNAALLL